MVLNSTCVDLGYRSDRVARETEKKAEFWHSWIWSQTRLGPLRLFSLLQRRGGITGLWLQGGVDDYGKAFVDIKAGSFSYHLGCSSGPLPAEHIDILNVEQNLLVELRPLPINIVHKSLAAMSVDEVGSIGCRYHCPNVRFCKGIFPPLTIHLGYDISLKGGR